jgi:glycosyltransferase involved in cell wall biosynthesis
MNQSLTMMSVQSNADALYDPPVPQPRTSSQLVQAFCSGSDVNDSRKKVVVYAGNIGEGQGLDKIIPQAAKLLGNKFQFLIIGDGGTKNLLQSAIEKMKLHNVFLKNP